MQRARSRKFAWVLFLVILGAFGFVMRRSRPRQAGQVTQEAGVRTIARPDDQATAAPTSRPAAGLQGAGGPDTDGSNADKAGRQADKPTEIPAKGWWQIAKRVFAQISEDRILAEAAGVTFYVLLAIFPAIATLVSLYGLIADPKTISQNLSLASGLLPGGGMQILHDQVTSLTSGPPKALGLGVVVGLLTSLWSANAGMKALFDALNVVYDEKEKRGFVLRTVLTLAFTLGALTFVILAMGGVVVLPAVLNFIGFGATADTLLKLGRWPALLIVLSLFLATIYRYGPSRIKARWGWVSWGGGAATVCWLLVSLAFSYYVENFGNYNKTYGSLGAAIGFMTWIWLSTTVVLIGAEMNAEMEHQTARDTTVGSEKPLGQRDASKADEVAAT